MKKLLTIALLLVMALAATAQTKMQPQDLLEMLKTRHAPDKRTAIWDVKATTNKKGVTTLTGKVGTQDMLNAINTAFKGYQMQNRLTVVENSLPDGRRWALVKLSIATLRTEGKHAAEVATQAIMGMPVKVLEKDDEWYRVQTPDNYISYVPESSLCFKTEAQMAQWRKARRCVVSVYDSRLVTEPGGDETVTDLVLSNILEFRGQQGDWVRLATPDGREGYILKSQVEDVSQWAQQNFDAALIEKTARRMMGSSYLWGGTSTKVTDCSGLVKVSYLANAIILQRDASQQALTGKKFNDYHQAQLGDLLFFGNSKTGRVTHVGIYLRDGKYIHCSGQVKVNSLDPKAPDYLYSPLSISRINGMIGTKGITYVRDHKWYFD
ncbi:MAG: C40 family peptidase [Muribaculaceae bacterium]|nr:C40 family peptidase [Muribaculaceae bacterium]MBR1474799.1 C40 family peptidase [Muribaculaceae bacterium]